MGMVTVLQYKCRKCGEKFDGKMVNISKSLSVLQGVIDDDLIASEIKQSYIHTCKDGSFGICDLSGIDLRSDDHLIFQTCLICNKDLFQGEFFCSGNRYYCREHKSEMK